jgi:hypothetical protein
MSKSILSTCRIARCANMKRKNIIVDDGTQRRISICSLTGINLSIQNDCPQGVKA